MASLKALQQEQRYIKPIADVSCVFYTPMRQPTQPVIRWFPAAVALVLAACSSNTLQNQVPDVASPIVPASEVVSTSPQPASTAIVSAGKRPATATSDADDQPSDRQPLASQSNLVTPALVKQPPAPIAGTPAAKPQPLERVPTVQANPRIAGFSPDGNYFMYLESSRDTGAGIPKAALQLVNVEANRCVENGCLETRYGEAEAGTNPTDAEADLLQQTWKVREGLKLTRPVAGAEVPILSRSRTIDGSETVTIRLQNGQPLALHLQQKSTSDQAAMQLEVTYNGQQRSIDSIDHFRTNVLDYSIRQVKLSPDGKRVAVLITATKPTFEGTLGTTLVQSFSL